MPSIIKWIGVGAVPVAQVDTFTVGAGDTVPVPGDVFAVIVNGKTISFTEGSTATLADVCTNLQALLAASTIPEFLEATWTVSSPVITATAATPGLPLAFTVSLTPANVAVPVFHAPTLTAGGSLSSGTPVYYVISAINGNGETTKSTQVTATPTGGNLSVVLTWTAVPGARGYKIYSSTTTNVYTTPALLTTIGTGSTITFTDTGAGVATGAPSGSNTASSTSTFVPAVATASSGPYDVSCAANYSGGALPVTGDTLYFQDSAAPALYNLDALASVVLLALYRMASFTGSIGLPNTNTTGSGSGYNEFRPAYFQIQTALAEIGQGPGSGPVLEKWDFRSGTTATVNVYSTGSPTNSSLPALLLLGDDNNILNAYAGSIGIAVEAGQTATFATVRAEAGAGATTSILFGSGCTLTTIANAGATLDISSAVTTLTQYGGQTTLRAGAGTTLTVNGGVVLDVSSSTTTTLVVSGKGKIDYTGTLIGKTVTHCTLYAGATLLDSYTRVTFTNDIILSKCRLADVPNLDLGIGITIGVE